MFICMYLHCNVHTKHHSYAAVNDKGPAYGYGSCKPNPWAPLYPVCGVYPVCNYGCISVCDYGRILYDDDGKHTHTLPHIAIHFYTFPYPTTHHRYVTPSETVASAMSCDALEHACMMVVGVLPDVSQAQ